MAASVEDATIGTEDAIQRVQEALLRIEAASGKSMARPVKEIMPQLLNELCTQRANQGIVGLPTGIHGLDLLTGGIRPGELWTIGALPGRGKTALGVQMLLANGKQGIPCCAFSLEMHSLEIGRRFVAAESKVSAIHIRHPYPAPVALPDEQLDVSTAAKRLGVSKKYLYQHAKDYTFARHEGRRLLFSGQGIADYISHKRGTTGLTATRRAHILSLSSSH